MSSYISLPTFAASLDQRLRLTGGRCATCGTIAFPKRRHCLVCNGSGFEDVGLRDTGEIYSFTVIAAGGAPAEFDQQQILTGAIAVGVVALDDGPRVIGQIVVRDPAALAIGTRLKAVPRRLYDQEGVVRYGLKFVPVAETAHE
jgi:uncharacterized OB-fold protein